MHFSLLFLLGRDGGIALPVVCRSASLAGPAGLVTALMALVAPVDVQALDVGGGLGAPAAAVVVP